MAFSERESRASFLRTFVFGVEDSLVSTVGLLSGIAIAGVPQKAILVSGVVLVSVEAFSMAVGSFLSEQSAEEFLEKKEVSPSNSIANGLLMFVSYFCSGIIPLFPYALLPLGSAFWVSIAFSLVALFLLGIVRAKISGLRQMKNAVRMAAIGGIAIAVGIAAGMAATSVQSF